ncbi:hypothetical protein V7114_18310 [Neobacillus niacini]
MYEEEDSFLTLEEKAIYLELKTNGTIIVVSILYCENLMYLKE